MSITITKTITTSSSGKRKDESSPTGWSQRVGQERVEGPKGGRTVGIYEPCEGPITLVYGSPEYATYASEHNGWIGGTIRTIIEGCTPMTVDLDADEVENLLRTYASQYADGLGIANGSTHQMYGNMTGLEAVRMADRAREKALRLGVDLVETNLFPS